MQNQKFNLHLGIIKILIAARGIEGPVQRKTMEMWLYLRVYISVTFLCQLVPAPLGWGSFCTLPWRGNRESPSCIPAPLEREVRSQIKSWTWGWIWAKMSCQALGETPSLRQLEAAAGGQMSYSQPVEGSHSPTGSSAEQPWGNLDAPSCSQQSPSDWEKAQGKAAGPHFPANSHLQAQTWHRPGAPWAPAKSKFSLPQAQPAWACSAAGSFP